VQIFLLACVNLPLNREKAHSVQVILYGKGPKGFCCLPHLVFVSNIGGFQCPPLIGYWKNPPRSTIYCTVYILFMVGFLSVLVGNF
jgi:hypothetical protein